MAPRGRGAFAQVDCRVCGVLECGVCGLLAGAGTRCGGGGGAGGVDWRVCLAQKRRRCRLESVVSVAAGAVRSACLQSAVIGWKACSLFAAE